MSKTRFAARVDQFVARLSATLVRVETPTVDRLSDRARGDKARGVRVSWALALTLDGKPISDEDFDMNFGGWFRTKADAENADWATFVTTMLTDEYWNYIDGGEFGPLLSAMVSA